MPQDVEERVESTGLHLRFLIKHKTCQTYLSTKPVLSKHRVPIGLSLPYCEKCGGYVIGDEVTRDAQKALKYNLEHIEVPEWYREGREPGQINS